MYSPTGLAWYIAHRPMCNGSRESIEYRSSLSPRLHDVGQSSDCVVVRPAAQEDGLADPPPSPQGDSGSSSIVALEGDRCHGPRRDLARVVHGGAAVRRAHHRQGQAAISPVDPRLVLPPGDVSFRAAVYRAVGHRWT